MISHQVITRSSVGSNTVAAIESYYKDAKDDYYSKENQPSQWQGKLAEELGLTGEVKKENFIQLMSGISPDHKTLRQNKFKNKDVNERLAIDLTFSAPKSISIESLVNGNTKVLEAHELAVSKTLELIEKRANTRIKKDGLSTTVNTGNLAIGKFRHETNRNNDPHLHTHALILNITKRNDGEYRALHNDSIVQSTKEFTKVYQGFLAKNLQDQGFKLRITKDGFELGHINDNQIKAFSSRSKEIEKELLKAGLNRETATTVDKQKATLSTRKKKTEKDIIQTRYQWAINAQKVGIKSFTAESNKNTSNLKKQKLDTFETVFNKENLVTNLVDVKKLQEEVKEDPRSFEFNYKSDTASTSNFNIGIEDFKNTFGKTKEFQGVNHAETKEPTSFGAEPTSFGAEPTSFGAEPTSFGAEPTDFGAEPTSFGAEPTSFGAEPTSFGADPFYGAEPTDFGADPFYGAEPTDFGADPFYGAEPKSSNQASITARDKRSVKNSEIDKDSRYINSKEISKDRIKKIRISSTEYSSENIGKHYSKRGKSTGDSLRIMSSGYVANSSKFDTVLLPIDKEIFVYNERADFSFGLSRNNDSSSSVTRELTKPIDESLDDIFTYHLIEESMKDKWKDKLESITNDDLNNEVLLFESKEQLKIFVVEHLTDKNNIIHEKDLKKELLDKGLGIITYDDVDEIINQMISEKKILLTDQLYNLNGEFLTEKGIVNKLKLPDGNYNLEEILNKNNIKKAERVYTTVQAYKDDHQIISMLNFSKNSNNPAYSLDDVRDLLNKTTLNDSQKRSSEMILTTKDCITGVQGYAGTGKSYMLKQTKEIIEQSNKTIHFFAPYSSQVKNLESDGLEAYTVSKLLNSKTIKNELNRNSIVVIDEAGVLDSKQMKQLLMLRQQIEFQLVLLGDTSQTKAVKGGSPFELLQQNGMNIEIMSDIQRQKNEKLKESVLLAVNDKMVDSVNNLTYLKEIKDKEERHNELVKSYISMKESERDETLIVSGTNEDRNNINNKIREGLGIAGKGIIVNSLSNIDISDSQKKLVFFYEKEDIVKFFRDDEKTGIKKDIAYKVIDIDQKKNILTISDENNNIILVNPKKNKDISLYKNSEIELSVGDKIRVTKSDSGLSTGDLFSIQSISKDTREAIAKDINGKIYTFDTSKKHHITHAYAMTVHSSQGLTYANVMADMDTKSLTLSKETFYVAISRAKNDAFVFTDDKDNLPNAVLRTSSKSNSISLFNDNININDIIKGSEKPIESNIMGENVYSKIVDSLSKKMGDDYEDLIISKDKNSSKDIISKFDSFEYFTENKEPIVEFLKDLADGGDYGSAGNLIAIRTKEFNDLSKNDYETQVDKINQILNSEIKDDILYSQENKYIFKAASDYIIETVVENEIQKYIREDAAQYTQSLMNEIIKESEKGDEMDKSEFGEMGSINNLIVYSEYTVEQLTVLDHISKYAKSEDIKQVSVISKEDGNIDIVMEGTKTKESENLIKVSMDEKNLTVEYLNQEKPLVTLNLEQLNSEISFDSTAPFLDDALDRGLKDQYTIKLADSQGRDPVNLNLRDSESALKFFDNIEDGRSAVLMVNSEVAAKHIHDSKNYEQPHQIAFNDISGEVIAHMNDRWDGAKDAKLHDLEIKSDKIYMSELKTDTNSNVEIKEPTIEIKEPTIEIKEPTIEIKELADPSDIKVESFIRLGNGQIEETMSFKEAEKEFYLDDIQLKITNEKTGDHIYLQTLHEYKENDGYEHTQGFSFTTYDPDGNNLNSDKELFAKIGLDPKIEFVDKNNEPVIYTYDEAKNILENTLSKENLFTDLNVSKNEYELKSISHAIVETDPSLNQAKILEYIDQSIKSNNLDVSNVSFDQKNDTYKIEVNGTKTNVESSITIEVNKENITIDDKLNSQNFKINEVLDNIQFDKQHPEIDFSIENLKDTYEIKNADAAGRNDITFVTKDLDYAIKHFNEIGDNKSAVISLNGEPIAKHVHDSKNNENPHQIAYTSKYEEVTKDIVENWSNRNDTKTYGLEVKSDRLYMIENKSDTKATEQSQQKNRQDSLEL